MELELRLPYPPSVNHYKTIGRTITTKTGKRLQVRVNSVKTKRYFWAVLEATIYAGCPRFGDATIELWVDVYPPDKRKRDLDGILKVLLDSLQHAGVYDDDYQIARLVVTRCATITNGQIIVRIKPYVTIS